VLADEPVESPVTAQPVAHPSEASAPSVPDASRPFPSRDELVQAWGDHVIGRLRPKAKALFQAGRFVSAEGGRAQFGLPNDIHRNRCEDMRPEVEAALADQFGRPIPLVLVVDGAPGAPVEPTDDGPEPNPPAPPVASDPHDDEDLAVFEADDLQVAEIDNSAEARLLQAFPGAEEVG
jgi:DNA polymerase-3 subunit gamma/tau